MVWVIAPTGNPPPPAFRQPLRQKAFERKRTRFLIANWRRIGKNHIFECTPGGVTVPGYWKNGAWVGLSPLSAAKSTGVTSLAVSGTDVYAGGYSNNASNVVVPGYWKNGTWTGLPTLSTTKNAFVTSLAVISK